MNGEFIHYSKANDEMYSLMGRWFASPMIRKEIGWTFEDNGYSWLLFLPIGFGSYNILGKDFLIQDIYIFKEHRHNGYCKKLLSKYEEIARTEKCKRILATCNNNSVSIFKSYGYKEHHQGKQWHKVEKNLQE